jgi:hypothetical protein
VIVEAFWGWRDDKSLEEADLILLLNFIFQLQKSLANWFKAVETLSELTKVSQLAELNT